jgi:integrase
MASLRRSPRTRYWVACFTGPDGRRIQRSTKEIDRARAQKIADRYGEAAHTGRLGFLAERQARKVIGDIYEISNREFLTLETVRAFFERWIKTKRAEAGHKTYTRYAGVVAQFLEWLGPRGQIGLSHLTSSELVRFRDYLGAKYSPGSVNTSLACIQSALGRAFRDGLVDVNEAARVEKLDERPGQRQQRRAFTDEELRSILEVCDSEWRGMVICGAYTGMRLGDVADLRWENIDLGTHEIRFSTEKTGRNMSLPIALPFYRHLMDLAGTDTPGDALFPRAFELRRRDVPTSALSNQFYRIMTKAGVVAPRTNKGKGKGRAAGRKSSALGFHALRHYATSLLKRAGVSDSVAMEIVGHDTAAISRIYSHIDAATLRTAIDKLPDITSLPAEGD